MSLIILDDMIIDESGGDSQEKKRVKITTACDTCRRRKVKCDGASPCANCTRGGLKSFFYYYLFYLSYILGFPDLILFISVLLFVKFVPIIQSSRNKILSCFNAISFTRPRISLTLYNLFIFFFFISFLIHFFRFFFLST